MSANARLLVEIAASLGTFREDMGKASAIAEASARRIERATSGVKDTLVTAGKSLLGYLGVTQIISAFETIRTAAAEEQRSLNQLITVLEATGHAAGVTAEQLEKLGQGIQLKSVFDDDAIRNAATALLRFRTISGDTFEELLKLAPDVATVLGVDLPAAAALLGKAVIDPARGLRVFKEAGVALSEQQIDLAARFRETGDGAGAARVAIDAITGSIGGAAEADNKGAYGASKRLTRAWDDLIKSFGRPLVADTKGIDKLTESLERFVRVRERAADPNDRFDIFKRIAETLGLRDETFAFPKQPSGEDSAVKAAKDREAAVGKTISEIKSMQDAEYAANKIHLQKLADGASAFNAAQLLLQRSSLDLEQDALESAYSRGEVSTEKYYVELRRLSKQSLDATTDDINAQIEAQAKIRSAKIPGTDSPLFDQATRESALIKETGLVNQANAARYQFFRQNAALTEKERVEVEKLGDEYADLAAQIALAAGNSAAAAAIAFERSSRGFRKTLEARGDTATLGQQAGLGEQLVKQAQLNDEQKVYNDLIEQLGIAQGRVDIARSSGAITELDALAQTSQANRDILPLMEARVEAYAAILQASGKATPEELTNLAKLRLELEKTASQTNLVGQKFKDIFENDAVNALDEFVLGTKSAKDAFSDFSKSIERDLTHMANQQIIKALGNALFGGGADSGGGGLIGQLIGSLISGGGTPGGVLAGGTDFARGGMTLVGERGPELVNMPRGAQVIPNDVLMAKRSARSVTVHNNFAIYGQADARTQNQIALAASRGVRSATARDA